MDLGEIIGYAGAGVFTASVLYSAGKRYFGREKKEDNYVDDRFIFIQYLNGKQEEEMRKIEQEEIRSGQD